MPVRPDTITFFCDSVKDHPKKRREVVIQSFVFIGASSSNARGWTDRNKSPRLQRQEAHLKNGRTLVGDQPYNSQTMSPEMVKETGIRESYSLKCPYCGTDPALRGEKLYDALDTLREFGVARVELGAIAAILSNMAQKFGPDTSE